MTQKSESNKLLPSQKCQPNDKIIGHYYVLNRNERLQHNTFSRDNTRFSKSQSDSGSYWCSEGWYVKHNLFKIIHKHFMILLLKCDRQYNV